LSSFRSGSIYRNSFIEIKNSDSPFLLLMLLLAAAATIMPQEIVAALLATVVFFSLVKVGGRRFNLLISVLLLQLTSSAMDPVIRVTVIGWSFVSLIWFGFVDNKEITEDGEKPETKAFETTNSTQLPAGLVWLFIFTVFSMTLSSLLSIGPIKALSATFRQLIFFVFVWLTYNNIRSFKDVKLVLYSLIFMGALNAYGIFHTILSEGITAATLVAGPIRFIGFFKYINMNFAGTTIAIASVLLLILTHLTNSKNNSEPAANNPTADGQTEEAHLPANNEKHIPFVKIINVLFTIVLFLFVLISNSRASMLVALLGFLFFFLIVHPKSRIILAGAVALITFSVILIPPVHDFVFLIFRAQNFLNIRDYLWAMSWDVIKDNPFFGTGPDLFKDYFYRYMTAPEGSYAHYMITNLYLEAGDSGLSHNFLLFRLTEVGIGGLITALWMPGAFFFYCGKTLRLLKKKNRNGYIIVAGITALGVGMVARTMFESIGLLTHGWLMVDLPFWLCFLVVIFYYQRFSENKNPVKNG